MNKQDNYNSKIELKVCPKTFCSSCLVFPEISPTLPCAKHGLIMVNYSEMPLPKKIYRWFLKKTFNYRFATTKHYKGKHHER